MSDEQIKKIAWDLGQYADDLPDEEECKDWLEQQLQDHFDELNIPPDEPSKDIDK